MSGSRHWLAQRRWGIAALAAAALVAVVAGAGALSTGAADAAVSVYPVAGSKHASPRTQISFRGIAPRKIGTVRVRGSRSGTHRGRLRAHSDGKGASFVSRKPFRRGESVLVQTGLDIAGARGGDFRLRIARVSLRTKEGGVPRDTVDPGKTDRFRTRGDLRPPAVRIETRTPAAAGNGMLFLDAQPKQAGSGRQMGPMIVDERGELVWFRPVSDGRHATDVRAQRYRGRPVLTWWQGHSTQGMGRGEYVIYDDRYRPVKRVHAGNGYRGDLHEFKITPRNTALITIYQDTHKDLSSVGGSRRGLVSDSIVQEIDIATGLVLFEWHGLDTIPLRASYKRPVPRNPKTPWDYVHVNSVDPMPDGDLLISARNTWGVYKLDRATAEIEWTLGGKRNQFKRGSGAGFAWQHDAQWHAGDRLTVFDNSSSPKVRKRSRGITLAIDEGARTARLEQALAHPLDLLAAAGANMQVADDGRRIIGWGTNRYFTEYSPDGRRLLDGRLATGYSSYRTYRHPWRGRPLSRPRAAARCGTTSTTVWASWNGATEVARWEILAGPRAGQLEPTGVTVPRSGFETRATAPGGARYVAVRALDAAGRTLRSSSATRCRG